MRDERTDSLVRSVAGFGLHGSPAPVPATVTDADGDRLFARLRWERITGLAVECAAEGWLGLGDGHLEALLRFHRDAMAWALSVERKLVGLADAFEEEGIRFAVLKGASVAHTAYEDPSLRSFCDLDLLVRSEEYPRACALLERLGHVRQRPEPRPGFEARFGKASVHEHPDDRVQVDLHRTLVLGPFGLWIRPEELLERGATFTLAGGPIPRLDDTGMMLNVAMHASLGWRPPRLAPLRDILEVARRGRVEWDVLAGWASRWRLAAVLEHAFGTASDTLGVPLPPEAGALIGTPTPRRERRALAAYVGELRREGGIPTSTIRAIPGLKGKAAYVWALAVPSREF
ncbi:MAG TPA: nucleotidyltransferase family protein, partial [Actinomycetota bacterium]